MPIISTVRGNLIGLAQSGRYTEIAHGANCQCVFGSGIAPQIAAAFPSAEEADQATVKGDKGKLGSFSSGYAEGLNNPSGIVMEIFNLYTQYSFGAGLQISYEAIEKAFKEVNTAVLDYKEGYGVKYSENQLMGIPMIGAGLGGGDWGRISEIINRVTPDVDIELVLWKDIPDGGFEEVKEDDE